MSSLKESYGQIAMNYGDDGNAITAYMSSTGTFFGSYDMNVNGSVTPQDFWVQPPPGFAFRLNYLGVALTDGGNPSHDDYGTVSGPLANGTQLFVQTNGDRANVEVPFLSNQDFSIRAATSFSATSYSGNVNVVNFRDLISDYARGLILIGDNLDKFGIIIQDDLSALIEHHAIVKGEFFPWNVS